MTPIAIVPIRSFSTGMRRLADQMGGDLRRRLTRALASHVTDAVTAANLFPLVVTADPDVGEWAVRSGIPTIDDPGLGLNEAAERGVAWVNRSSSPWLVVHSDLPLLSSGDLEKLAGVFESGRNPIAPSLDGGTSAIGGAGGLSGHYGVGSFHLHLASMTDPEVIVTTGLLHDLDSYDALVSASKLEAGAWLRSYL